MKAVEINGVKYEVVEGDKNLASEDELTTKITDYFDEFDYIFGDYIDGKVRLKGFCDKKNKRCKPFNDINGLEKYRNEYCTQGAKIILLKKIK